MKTNLNFFCYLLLSSLVIISCEKDEKLLSTNDSTQVSSEYNSEVKNDVYSNLTYGDGSNKVIALATHDNITEPALMNPCGTSPSITGPSCLNVGNFGEYCVDDSYDSYDWNVSGGLTILSGHGTNCVLIRSTAQNVFAPVVLTITDGECTFTTTFYINTSGTPNFDLEFSDPVCIGDIFPVNILGIPSNQVLQAINWNVKSGGLTIVSSNSQRAMVEAVEVGRATLCATVVDECQNEATQCTYINVGSCSNDGSNDGGGVGDGPDEPR